MSPLQRSEVDFCGIAKTFSKSSQENHQSGGWFQKALAMRRKSTSLGVY